MTNKLSIEPVGIRVLIKPDTLEDGVQEDDNELVTKGGIVVPKKTDYATDREHEKVGQAYGTVIAIGRLAWQDYDRFATKEGWHRWAVPGDRVAYARYAGQRITDPETGEQYLVMNDNDINAKVHSKKENLDD